MDSGLTVISVDDARDAALDHMSRQFNRQQRVPNDHANKSLFSIK